MKNQVCCSIGPKEAAQINEAKTVRKIDPTFPFADFASFRTEKSKRSSSKPERKRGKKFEMKNRDLTDAVDLIKATLEIKAKIESKREIIDRERLAKLALSKAVSKLEEKQKEDKKLSKKLIKEYEEWQKLANKKVKQFHAHSEKSRQRVAAEELQASQLALVVQGLSEACQSRESAFKSLVLREHEGLDSLQGHGGVKEVFLVLEAEQVKMAELGRLVAAKEEERRRIGKALRMGLVELQEVDRERLWVEGENGRQERRIELLTARLESMEEPRRAEQANSETVRRELVEQSGRMRGLLLEEIELQRGLGKEKKALEEVVEEIHRLKGVNQRILLDINGSEQRRCLLERELAEMKEAFRRRRELSDEVHIYYQDYKPMAGYAA